MTTTLYKLTDRNGYTQRGEPGETLWVPGQWVEVKWGGKLCEAGCLHAYSDPLLAELLDPAHALLGATARLWVAEGHVRATAPDKVGCDRLRVLREHERIEVSTSQRARFAILCAMRVCSDAAWTAWARRWLSGSDRSSSASGVAAVRAAAYPASAASFAANAADYAANNAAYSAARAANNAAYSAARAANNAASAAAYTAAYSALYAARADAYINLLTIAEQAILEEP